MHLKAFLHSILMCPFSKHRKRTVDMKYLEENTESPLQLLPEEPLTDL